MIEKDKRVSRDIDQLRAAYAWARAENCSEKYSNLAKSAPALIMNNGLMQTLAFYKTKGNDKKEGDPHIKLLDDICNWLAQLDFCKQGDSSFVGVMKVLHGSESIQYRRATEEALALLRWIRQFAAALQKNN